MTARTRPPLALACLLCALALSAGCVQGSPDWQPGGSRPAPSARRSAFTFAVVGDYGTGGAHTRAVADLVASWSPAYVVSLGDGYYNSAGGTGTAKYDMSTGAFYGEWLKDISTTGRLHPVGTAKVNAFFPALGNHDLSDATPSPQTYLTYFKLPGSGLANTSGNERYYDFVQGPVHFFVVNSNESEPDGTGSGSKQAQWLRRGLAVSTARWNIVYFHHPPYSSQKGRPSAAYMRWPFASWGADAVLSGHAHEYERIMRDGMPYFVNGLGGAPRYSFSTPVTGSVVRYRKDWGAQKVTIADNEMTFEFFNTSGEKIDSYSVPSGLR